MNSKNINYYEKTTDFTYSYRDAFNNPFPKHILECFQDVAGEHAKLLKVGYDDLISKDQIWVLVKARYKIISQIPYEGIRIKTWPQEKGVLEFNREFKMFDLNDNLLVLGTSRWCIIDINTRKIVRARNINYQNIDSFIEEKNFEDPYEALVEFEHDKSNYLKTFEVNFSMIDHNFHLNNSNYASFIIDSLKMIETKKITDLQINFLNECRYKNTIKTYAKVIDENRIEIEGIRDDGVVSFISLLQLENM